MFEQRFDHICADHAVAMEAIEQRVREVMARRNGDDSEPAAAGAAVAEATVESESDADSSAEATGPAPEETPATAAAAVRSGASVSSARGVTSVPAARDGPDAQPPAGARWPDRDRSGRQRAELLDPRWNSDLL